MYDVLTASYFTYAGPGRVSIARWMPRGHKATTLTYRALAPGAWFNKVPPREFVRLYRAEVLGRLDPRRVWDELHQLVDPHPPVLLCWERPPFSAPERWWERPVEADAWCDFSNWCHRRLCSAWLEDALGVAVPEWAPPRGSAGVG